ncbi:hypothetical protein BLNAU_24488 [Blattamonas nauphoetae]|uniref:Uncharacterized protein n=1 Tax=Blattamonas nauphoetae TaxID=2049346 RepID=A0ABQ9WM92_9EUKA|nr:hypothetical protein BLNAU_24488 [Blattamonas nauphoetae]
MIGVRDSAPASQICCGTDKEQSYDRIKERYVELSAEVSGEDVGDQAEISEWIEEGAEQGDLLLQQETAYRLAGLAGIFGKRMKLHRPGTELSPEEEKNDAESTWKTLTDDISLELAEIKTIQAERKAEAQATFDEVCQNRKEEEQKLQKKDERIRVIVNEYSKFKADNLKQQQKNREDNNVAVFELHEQKSRAVDDYELAAGLHEEIDNLNSQLITANYTIDKKTDAHKQKADFDQKVVEMDTAMAIDALQRVELQARSDKLLADYQITYDAATQEADCDRRKKYATIEKENRFAMATYRTQLNTKLEAAAKQTKPEMAERLENDAEECFQKQLETAATIAENKVTVADTEYDRKIQTLTTALEKALEAEKAKCVARAECGESVTAEANDGSTDERAAANAATDSHLPRIEKSHPDELGDWVFTVHPIAPAFSSRLSGGSKFEVMSSQGGYCGRVQDNADGTYTCRLTASLDYRHVSIYQIVHHTIVDKETVSIVGSPFSVEVPYDDVWSRTIDTHMDLRGVGRDQTNHHIFVRMYRMNRLGEVQVDSDQDLSVRVSLATPDSVDQIIKAEPKGNGAYLVEVLLPADYKGSCDIYACCDGKELGIHRSLYLSS